jgi:hypothetical protein
MRQCTNALCFEAMVSVGAPGFVDKYFTKQS